MPMFHFTSVIISMKTNGTRYYLFALEKRLFLSRSVADLTHTEDLAIAAVFTRVERRRQASVARIGTSLAVQSTEPSHCLQFSLDQDTLSANDRT